MKTWTEILADARSILFNDSTNTQLDDTTALRYANQGFRRLAETIKNNDGDWQAFGEISTIDMVADQREYLLTDTTTRLDRILGVYIKIEDGGEYQKAKKRDFARLDVDINEYYPVQPEYNLLERSMFIALPAVEIPAITAGIQIYHTKDILDIEEGTDEPELPTFAVEYLSLFIAYKYCLGKKDLLQTSNFLRSEMERLEEKTKEHFASRNESEPVVITVKDENYY
jgi:hypothetical protein